MKKNYIVLTNHTIIIPAITAADLRDEWESIQDKGTDLTDLLGRCIRKVAKQLGIDPAEVQKEYDDYIGDVWIDLYGRFSDLTKLTDQLQDRAAKGKTSVTLATPICKSAKAVLMRDIRERGNQWDADSLDQMLESGYSGSLPAEDVFDDFFFTSLSVDAIIEECPELRQKIRRMIMDGYTAPEIARETGVSEDTVYREKKKFRRAAQDLLY